MSHVEGVKGSAHNIHKFNSTHVEGVKGYVYNIHTLHL